MFELYQRYAAARGQDAPDWGETVSYLKGSRKPTARDVLRRAKAENRMLVQPRCGVGAHDEMTALLRALETGGPDILTLTIDAHTRLGQFDAAERVLAENARRLNGYPLVCHGWRRGREINEAMSAPIEIRHGSPDGRVLFACSLASGMTSYEGGGIGYNLPYCKDVAPADSLAWWREIDSLCGELASAGVIVDREFFGTLTAVLMPPSISLSSALIEAMLAAEVGVRCMSIAVPQTGNCCQDVAALQALRRLASALLPAHVEVYAVLHQFMGAFPTERVHADALIAYSALTGRLGGAVKIINKTHQESLGVPTAEANVLGILLTRMATSWIWDLLPIDLGRVEEEREWIEREVRELVEPLLEEPSLLDATVKAIACGRFDVPFSANRHARSDIIPVRDSAGAIRFARFGNLPFSDPVRQRNIALAGVPGSIADMSALFRKVRRDVLYFAEPPSAAASDNQANRMHG